MTTGWGARTTSRSTGRRPNRSWRPSRTSWSAYGRSGRSSAGRCTTWWPKRASGSSWTSGPGCLRGTTRTKWHSGWRRSYLTIAHPASDVATDQMAASMQKYNEHVTVPLTARSHDEVSAFFAGLDLVDPGVVQLHGWRAGTGDPGTGRELANYGGVGRKP